LTDERLQPFYGSRNLLGHRAHRPSGQFGNFSYRVPIQITQYDCNALMLRKPADRLNHGLLFVRYLVRWAGGRRIKTVEWLHCIAALVCADRFPSSDLAQPHSHRIRFSQFMQTLVRDQERFLSNVLRGMVITEDLPDACPHKPLVPQHQALECVVIIAGQNGLDLFGIGLHVCPSMSMIFLYNKRNLFRPLRQEFCKISGFLGRKGCWRGEGGGSEVRIWPLAPIPQAIDQDMLRLRCWVATGARMDPSGAVGAIAWDRWQQLRQVLLENRSLP
jgi:hypothetical protein